jgi:hypothetical protein
MRRRSLVLGAIVVGAYLVVLALTVGLRNDHVRPLYDGFTPPPSYQWVDPPSFFSSGNVTPKPVVTTIKLHRDGSEAAGIATPDGQFVINLARGAIKKSPGAASVTVRITPLAASQLPKLPDGMRANGNVYRLHMRYETGANVKHLTSGATLVMQIPELANNLFVASSPEHKRPPWVRLDSSAIPPNQLSLTASWDTPGYFVAGTKLPELVGPSGSSGHVVVIGIAVAVLAVLLLVAALVVVRRRRRVNAP